MKDAVSFDAVERVSFKRSIEVLQESRRTKRRKVLITVAEAVALEEAVLLQVSEVGIQAANNVFFGIMPVTEMEVVSPKANMKKAQEKVAKAKEELNELFGVAESIAE